MTSRRLATALCSLAAVSLLATACGDDPVDAGSGAGTSESTLPSSEGSPTGEGTLVIAGTTYLFEADVCALTPVNHGARDYQVYVHGTGDTDGVPFEVEVTRTISDSGDVIEMITYEPGVGELAGAVNAVGERSEELLQVSSTLLTGAMEFVGTRDMPIGPGSVSVACA